MQSKLPLLHSCPGGVRKSTFRGPWRAETTTHPAAMQGAFLINSRDETRFTWFRQSQSLVTSAAAIGTTY